MKLFTALAAATILASTSAFAGPLTGGFVAGNGGEVMSSASSGGTTIGTGSNTQTATHFSGNQGVIEGGLVATTGIPGHHARLEVMVTNESVSNGSNSSVVSGSSVGGSSHLGTAFGGGGYLSWGAGSW